MTAANYSTTYIFPIPKSGTIAYIGLRPGTSTSGHVTVAIQTVNSSGQPSGTNYGGSAPSASTALTTNTPLEIALGTAATAAEGDLVALVVTYASGTTVAVVGDGRLTLTVPYSLTYNASAYTLVSQPILCTLGYSNITATGESGYVPIDNGSPAIESFTTTAYNSGSTTFRRALKITAPCDMAVEGVWVWGAWASGASVLFSLYASNGTNQSSSTPIAQTVASADVDGYSTTGIRFLKFSSTFGALPVSLTNGSIYYLSMEPQNTNNFTDYEMTFSAFAYQYSNPINNLPGGTDAVLSTGGAASAGNITWTPTATRRPLCGLMVSQFAQSAISGGMLVGQGTAGRMNG